MTKRRFFTDWITYIIWQFEKIAVAILAAVAIIVLIRGELLIISADASKLMQIQPERVSLDYQIRYDMEHMEVPAYLLENDVAPEEVIVEEPAENDVWMLAQAMHAEEGVFFKYYDTNPELVELAHKLAGSVILNRRDIQYKKATTVEEVIFSHGQYAEQTQDRVREGQDIPDIVYTWAEELLTYGSIGPKGMIYQSEFDQGEVYQVIGNQHFGVEPKYNN